MVLRLLFLLFIIAFVTPHTLVAQEIKNPEAVKEQITEWRGLIRGPYRDIRWFCSDGTVREPKDPCPNDKDAIQRARLSPELIRYGKDYHFFPAQILAGGEKADFWDASYQQSRLKQYQIDKYLQLNDNGWILERGQYYRGAFQIEDEQKWGKDFLIWALADEDKLTENFFLLRQAVQRIPHREDTPGTIDMRALSKTLSESYTKFMDLRVKIHGQPDRTDLAAVRAFKKEHEAAFKPDQLQTMNELIEVMEQHYSFDRYEEIKQQLKGLPADHPLRGKVNDYLAYFHKDSPDIAHISATSDLMRDIRDEIMSLSRGSYRLAAMDISLMLEQVLYRTAGKQKKPTVLEQLEEICYLEQATAASGYLAPWEWYRYSSDQWSVPDSTTMPLGALLFSAEQSRRLLEWSTNLARSLYGKELEMFTSIEPKARTFIDDLIRSSVLLPLGMSVERLSAFAAAEADLKNDIAALSNPSTMRGLNPGFAKGELVVIDEASEDMEIDPKKIYVFDHPPADLKPVAGIATVSEGNMVSHVQLLARNLAIPNAVLSEENLNDLKRWDGDEVFYAVSPGGTIILKPAKKMSDQEKELFAVKERSEERVTVPLDKMQLETRRIINLRELNAASSGRWCGPKAANLGQLKQMFPEQVVEGFVLPFGLFKAHMEQTIPGRDLSYWAFLQQGFKTAEQERSAGKSEAEIETNLLAHLGELRTMLETIPFLPGFQQEFRDSFARILNQPFGELPVFLRSDTNMEDLKDFTGAGLNKTIFNVRDEQKIWQGIREVWISPYTERSFKWRQRYLNNPENVYPSLLVIPGVNVDYSGVVITQNVSNGRLDEITAAFSRGVGGAVDGQRAETYTIFPTGHIAMLSPAREVNYLYLPTTGGTNKGVDPLANPLLNLRNLTSIKNLSDFVEANYPREEGSKPITYDMEMGFKDDHLWLFQVRPFVENKQAAASGYLQSINPRYEPYQAVDLTQKI